MSNKKSQTLQFVFNCFFLAVLINSVVATAQILHEKDFQFFQEIQIFLLCAGISAVVFAAACLLLYLICRVTGMGSERTFWFLITLAIIAAAVLAGFFKSEFYQYTNEHNYFYFGAISAFSIMVSLASQYQFFHKGNVQAQASH